jgi:hypothetical protein
MSTGDAVIDARVPVRVTYGMLITGVIGLTAGFTIGCATGVFAVPFEALDVPVNTGVHGGPEPAYRPVPTTFTGTLLIVPLLGAAVAYMAWEASRSPSDDEDTQGASEARDGRYALPGGEGER